jgi:hypothetical protein
MKYYEHLKYLYSNPKSSWLHEHTNNLTIIPVEKIEELYNRAVAEDVTRNIQKSIMYPAYRSFFQYLDTENKGTVTYYFDEAHDPRKAKGLYSTSVYVRPHSHFKLFYSKYWKGIHCYTEMMEKDGPFASWMLVIYTDYYSARIIEIGYENYYHQRLPKTICLAIVQWEAKKEKQATQFEQIDTSFLRCARFRAFVDFHNKPVAVRDADTIYQKYYKDYTPKILREGEEAFWKNFMKLPHVFSCSTQKEYTNAFHTDVMCEKFHINPGTFAGFVNSKGNIPEWTDSGILWKDCIDYIEARDHIRPEDKKVENSEIYYIGKDEQILLFRVMPRLFDRIYFFNMEYTSKEEITAPPPYGRNIPLMTAEYVNMAFSNKRFSENIRSLIGHQLVKYVNTCGLTKHRAKKL